MPCVVAAVAALAASRTAPRLCGLFAGSNAYAREAVHVDDLEWEIRKSVIVSAQDVATAQWQEHLQT
eukprot:4624362-Alexandrium_andersonii.AAC.1